MSEIDVKTAILSDEDFAYTIRYVIDLAEKRTSAYEHGERIGSRQEDEEIACLVAHDAALRAKLEASEAVIEAAKELLSHWGKTTYGVEVAIGKLRAALAPPPEGGKT